MRMHLVEAITRAVDETFRIMFSSEVKIGEPCLRADPVTFDGISAIIGLTGRLAGSVSLHCPNESAFAIASKLLGSEVREVCPEVHDAIGELANVVAGSTKRLMSERSSLFDISIPTVVSGVGHRVTPWVKWPSTHVAFACPGLNVRFEVVLSLAREDGGDPD